MLEFSIYDFDYWILPELRIKIFCEADVLVNYIWYL